MLRNNIFPALLIAAVALVAYHNSFSGALVFDDVTAVSENTSIRQLWPPGPALSPPPDAGIGGRPVANLSFAVNYALGGLGVRSFHGFNLALHTLTALALFGVLRRTFLQPVLRARFGAVATPLALAIAALWVAHPLTTAVVDYISQRTEALMAFFYLVTLYCFIRGIGDPVGRGLSPTPPTMSGVRPDLHKWHVLAVISCALGMASKEVMVTAPVMVLLYDRTFVAGTWGEAWRRRWPLHLALAATWLLLAWLMVTSRVANRGVGFGQGVTAANYALTECTAIARYLWLSLWPHPLVFDHGWAFVRDATAALPQALVCAALVGATLYALWRRPALGFAGCWFLLILAPTSSIVPVVQQPIAESRAYLPLAGVLALVAAGGFLLLRQRAAWAAALVVVLFAALTVQRNVVYRTPVSLWSDTLRTRPENARAHCELGRALIEAGREEEAIAAFNAAVRLRPSYPMPYNNLAAWLVRVERAPEALVRLDTALDLDPLFVEAHFNRGLALMQLARAPEAMTSFETALRLRPDHARAHLCLGVAQLNAGRAAEALEHEEAALRLDPTLAAVHYNLANALVALGRLPEAIAHYRRELQLDPTFVRAENNLGVTLLRAGDIAGAIAHFEAALRLNPNYADARKNLEAVRGQNARP